MESYIKGIENENLYGDSITEITEPFNPKDVDIIVTTMTIANLIDRLRYDEIDLYPDFQRSGNLWDKVQQSRLIESLIVRIPLPAFYFDGADDDNLVVIDGLQRLTAIKHFAVDKSLALEGLEYLSDLEGKTFDQLSPSLKRRVCEQNITAYIIRKGTPLKVRTSIFTRINTGGIQLNAAEIKNSVYRGRVSNLLKELAHSEEFKNATCNKVPSKRMLDREFVNRFLAFYVLDRNSYKGNLENFLVDVLDTLTNSEEHVFDACRNSFKKAMQRCWEIFGEHAFRKIMKNGKYGSINKPLFECVSVCFAELSEKEYTSLYNNKNRFLYKYTSLLKNEEFIKVITSGTAKIDSVKNRDNAVSALIQESLHD